MKFGAWIKKNGYTREYIARRLNMDGMRLHRILHGSDPTLSEVLEIEILTQHQVAIQDFIETVKRKRNEQCQKKPLPKKKSPK